MARLFNVPFGMLSLVTAVVFSVLLAADAQGQMQPIVSGFNMGIPLPMDTHDVPFDPVEEHWTFDADLIFDPDAPPMTKVFESPRHVTGAPILLDAAQPLPFGIWEDFYLVPDGTGMPGSEPVSDWHEEILIDGWVWVLPGDPLYPGTDPSLITQNGQPWSWEFLPHPSGTSDPSRLWVKFPPIEPGNVLDIHKALLWVGTPGNSIWGDGMDDLGNQVPEAGIPVLEYPTPEPGALLLALLCVAGCSTITRRLR